MPLPKAQLKSFIRELAKSDKPIAKALNKAFFQPSDEEVAEANPQLKDQSNLAATVADNGSGQSTNAVGNSQIVSPAVGPGGV